MVELGYKLSSEEHRPNDLVRFASLAEDAGFSFAMISDHFHPWTDSEGQSPFVWSTLGGIAHATKRLVVGTAVTCPTMRTHPAIIAHASATIAAMMPGRFILTVGTGEALNEHILGEGWPEGEIRLAMLEEAIEIIRALWTGERISHHGVYYSVEDARLYTLPPEPPQLFVAADAKLSTELAGRVGDGLMSTLAKDEITQRFEEHGGAGKPKYVEMTVCWAEDEARARKTAHEIWPIAGMPGPLMRELKLPKFFEQVASLVTEDAIAQAVVCGADPQKHIEKIEECAKAGFDHVIVHQIGPDQEGFFRFYQREILPRLGEVAKAA